VAEPYWASDGGDVVLHLGKCETVLPTLPANSVDAVVTDPPAAISFMGRAWDGNLGGRAQWVAWLAGCMGAAARVLKPGGHLLVWSLPRTSHWTAWAVEDAGLEIRDCILHLFGSGFPKSLDVSKAIDKRAEENIETKRRIAAVAEVIRSHREAKGMTPQQVSMAVVGTPSGACWNWEHQQLPSAEMWPAIKAALGIPGKYDALIEGDRARFIAAEREVTGRNSNHRSRPDSPSAFTVQQGTDGVVTAPATEDAARWEGWGTALKPGQEIWWLARKPLKGTVAGNVLEFGTGALNIDGCKVAHVNGENPSAARRAGKAPGRETGSWGNDRRSAETFAAERPGEAAGRWPANVVFTHSAACDDRCAPDCPAGELDRQSGQLVGCGGPKRTDSGDASMFGIGQPGRTYERAGGGASRFYPVFRYQAKAPASERPRLEDGTAHETVKPLGLISWAVRLITPPGGTVLDMFGGSGPVAEACIIEGFRCVIIEKDPQSADLIRKRLGKPIQPVMFGLDAG
jgi:hypothetical protein